MMQNSTEKTVPAGIKRDTPGILFQNALRLVKEHIATSLSIEPDDLDLSPFDRRGGFMRCSGRITKRF